MKDDKKIIDEAVEALEGLTEEEKREIEAKVDALSFLHDDTKLLAVPSETKYVLTIGFNEERQQYGLALLDMTDILTYEETMTVIDESIEDIANLVEIIEYHIEEKTRVKSKEELRRSFKVVKGDE